MVKKTKQEKEETTTTEAEEATETEEIKTMIKNLTPRRVSNPSTKEINNSQIKLEESQEEIKKDNHHPRYPQADHNQKQDNSREKKFANLLKMDSLSSVSQKSKAEIKSSTMITSMVTNITIITRRETFD